MTTQQALYSLSQADYHAITSGNNGYAAGPGYNLVTGLGTPVANLLVPDLIAGSSSGPTVAPMPDTGLVYSGGAGPVGTSVNSVFTPSKASPQGTDEAGALASISPLAHHAGSDLFAGSETLVLAAARNPLQTAAQPAASTQSDIHSFASGQTGSMPLPGTTPDSFTRLPLALDVLSNATADGDLWLLQEFDLDWMAATPNYANQGYGPDSRVEAVAAGVLEWVAAHPVDMN